MSILLLVILIYSIFYFILLLYLILCLYISLRNISCRGHHDYLFLKYYSHVALGDMA